MLVFSINGCGGNGSDDKKAALFFGLSNLDLSKIAASWSADGSSAIMVDVDGNTMIVKSDSVVWTAPSGENFVVYYGGDGLPNRAVADGYIILYENWTSDTVDIAIISPDGSYSINRKLAVDSNLISSLTANKSVLGAIKTSRTRLAAIFGFSEINLATVLKVGGQIVSLAQCGAGIYAAVQTGGLAWGGAVWACKSTVMMIAKQFTDEDNALVEATGSALTAISLIEGCSGDNLSCIIALVGFAETILEGSESTQQDLSVSITEAEVELLGGNSYTVTYNGNGSTGGSAPTDTTNYEEGQTVTVLGNTGNLVKTGESFAGWNTQTDGNGTNYTQGQTFTMGAANVTLYAKWTAIGATGPAGGLIFYDKGSYSGSPSWRYLEAAPSDQSIDAEWGCYATGISGADGTAVGTGYQNTIDIEAGCATSGTAADICANLDLGGYTDWFLPSKDELNLMYVNLHKAGVGGFADLSYWSSSEYNAKYAWLRSFSDGFQYHYSKTFSLRVRAVRAF